MAEEKEQIELDLDDSQETEVDVANDDAEQQASEEDNFDKAENATQKRIDRLTKKMREAERQREEALKYAQNVQAEAHQLKQRMDALDSNYVNEYSSRVESQIASAKKNWLKLLKWATQTALLRLNGLLPVWLLKTTVLSRPRCSRRVMLSRCKRSNRRRCGSLCLNSSPVGRTLKQSSGLKEILGLVKTRR